MSRRPALRAGTRHAPVIAAVAAALLLTACAGEDGGGTAASQDPPPARSAPNAEPEADAGAGSEPEAGSGAGQDAKAMDLARSAPQRVSIPSLGVSSELETLGQNKDGAMTTPENPDLAGWYEPGPAPGSRGPAVIAGHVTWNGADAVFKGLKTMKAGDTIEVAREDGKTATFTADRVEEYPKKKFPTLEVYKNIDHAGLRLITCGGEFDADRHYYANNVTVFASMTGVA
ncbi:class F sortase [Streptomyces longisporoflavus]|uniref:class F sortase n=1 Tax=Streptomyces longisporoflavus TaxID=28044 RepID=UPI00167EC813|nr:class F sortase [Streptomyces longisporoflavus]GGV59522.1 class F sortase [Streptomyces longisporoflavus]